MTEPTVDADKTAEETKVTKKETKPKKEKEVVKEKEDKAIVLQLDWKNVELSADDNLPSWFLEKKLKDDQLYIPVGLYREIMRQLDCFGVPQFSDPEKFMSGKNKSQIDMITYRVKCSVERFKYGRNNAPVILTGVGYSSFSGGVLLSDAIHGNIATLDAKALRSALKHSYRIFEYPEKDVTAEEIPGDVNATIAKANETLNKATPAPAQTSTPASTPASTPTTKAPVKVDPEASKAIDNAVADIPTQSTGPSVESQISEEYKVLHAELLKALYELDPDAKTTKQMILDLASKLKAKYGEQYKKYILWVITKDLNSSK